MEFEVEGLKVKRRWRKQRRCACRPKPASELINKASPSKIYSDKRPENSNPRYRFKTVCITRKLDFKFESPSYSGSLAVEL